MIDETGDELRCPLCESADSCQHHLLCIDETFSEVLGGFAFQQFGAIQQTVENRFRNLIAAEGIGDRSWSDSRVQDLWDSMELDEDDPASLCLESEPLRVMIQTLLEEAGAVRLASYADSAPGQSSLYSNYYAESPAAVLEVALADLDTALLPVGV